MDEIFQAICKIASNLDHAGHVYKLDFGYYTMKQILYHYILEDFATCINAGEHAAGNTDFDYAKMSNVNAEPAHEGLIQEKAFYASL